jgi:hypothetical protein
VTLPASATGQVLLEDVRSNVALSFRVVNAPAARRVDVDGVSIYQGAGIVHRVHSAGIDDSVAFRERPAREELEYALDVTHVSGLRLVNDSLEALDAEGAPGLRVAPPVILDASGNRHPANLTLEGCAYDTSLAAPWGRPVTVPGASHCTLHVSWSNIQYPALLDPAWVSGGTSGGTRDQHLAVRLLSGKVLLAFGNTCGGGCFPLGNAELYDPSTKTFAGTGGAPDKGSNVTAIGLANGKALVFDPNGTLLYDPVLGTMAGTGAATFGGAGAVTLASGKVLIAGATASLYDPANNTFSATGPMVASRSQPAVALLASGKVLVSGGGGLATAEIYDPALNTFTATAGNMAAPRAGHFAFTLASGKVFIVGGGPSTSETFDPASGAFTASGAFLQTRTDFGAALLPTGKILVVGGFVGTSATTSTERWDPATGLFTTGPSLNTARGYDAATLLADGSLLASFGRTSTVNNAGISLGSVEILPSVAAGGVCTVDDDCGSAICDHGVCCQKACGSSCHACTAGTGACDAVKSADDPDTCTGAKTCDASGTCKSKLGQACTAGGECVAGFCVDGVCCNRACTDTCEACDGLVKGTCGPIPGKPHGKRACTGNDSLCGGACDGTTTAVCKYPDTTTGCGTSCSMSSRIARACDGKGACVALPERACPGNFVCQSATSCKTSCASKDDCIEGFACTGGACTPAGACDGNHTIVSADGKSTTDCAPFKCDVAKNTCITSCKSVNDCANPFICDGTGVCAASPGPGDTSGCNAGGGSRGGTPGPDSLVLLGLAAIARYVGRGRARRRA